MSHILMIKNKKINRKEVKKMKRIFTMFVGLALCSMFLAANAMADPAPITSYSQVIEVHTVYNQFGVAIGSTSKTTTTITTEKDGETSTTISVTTVHAEWEGGSLKTKTVESTSDTTSSDGSTSHSEYTDTYVYDEDGKLVSVSGTGSSNSYDAEKKQWSYGTTITRNFEVRDGQALLISQTESGYTNDNDGNRISTYTSTTTNSDWVYAGGNWVSNTSTTHSHTDVLDGVSGGNGGWTDMTRTTTYTRNAAGTITGISGSISGEQFQVTGIDPETGEVSGIHYTLTAIDGQPMLDFRFDSQMGWYLAGENYQWVSDPQDTQPYDPWTQGTLAMVDGHLALIVNPNDLAGGFYSLDPSQVTGETKRDADGNYIFMLRVDDDQIYQEFKSLVGHKINLCWQHYATAGAENSRGYAWLSLESDWRQAVHLQGDNMTQVTQFGGSWDRSKPYVVID